MNFSSVGKNTKRFLSILLVMTVVLMSFPLSVFAGDPGTDLWTDVVTEKPAGYDDTDPNDVKISTAEGLAWLSSVVNELNNATRDDFEDKTVTLTADIDLGAYLWTPIGNGLDTDSGFFKGTFDGGGHRISGVVVDITMSSDDFVYAGLFGYVKEGTVKNVLVSGEVTGAGDGTSNCAGGIVGFSYHSTVSNCSFEGEVRASRAPINYAGGIVGSLEDSKVLNCKFDGEATVSGEYSFNCAGGIAGYAAVGMVSKCSYGGNVTANGDDSVNNAGGIVGYNFLSQIISCNSDGTVTSVSKESENSAGGIVGYNYEGEILNCENSGFVNANGPSKFDNVAGGIAGINAGIVEDFYNIGAVTASGGIKNYAGGVIGYNDRGAVDGCRSEGEVTADGSGLNFTGGIVAMNSGTVQNCYHTGYVDASVAIYTNYSGGIAGYNYGLVENCYNIGAVNASGDGSNNYAGGIAGYNDRTVANCYSSGAVSTSGEGPSNCAGGLVGYNRYYKSIGYFGYLTNSYWLKNTAADDIGIGGDDNFNNCSSFTAAQGRGTSRDFTYKITVNGVEEEKTGTLLDALNAWVGFSNGDNNGEAVFLHWSQAHISYNQGYPVLGDAPPAPDPSLTVPIRGGGQSISTPVSTSGTTVTIRVPYLPSLENIASAAAEAKESVLIDLSSLNDSYDTALIQQSILRTVTESAALGLALVMPDGKQVNFDQTGLSFFEKIGSGDLKLSVRTVAADEISREQRNIIGSAPVYELSVFVGEKKVTDFGGGLAGVKIPVVGEPVADPVVWRMDFDAKGEVDLKALPCSYDAGTNSYGFETTGFSLYVIGDYPFVDTADSAWYYEDTVFTYGRGLFQGTTRTTFAPLQDMKRCQLVTVLWRLEGKPQASGKGFSDVAGGEYFADALAWASANGIILGYENGDFGPYDSITRQQFALVMYRYAKYKGYDVEKGAGFDLAAFEDEDDVSGFALGAVRWLCGNDVIRGNNGRILPHKSASRAEVAAMLRRFSESVVVP